MQVLVRWELYISRKREISSAAKLEFLAWEEGLLENMFRSCIPDSIASSQRTISNGKPFARAH